jgi:hypothetical protein
MPLLPNVLSNQLSSIMDKDSPSFIGFPPNIVVMASNWGNALAAYLGGIIPPSATLPVAKQAFESLMLTMNTSNGLVVFPQAFTSMAAALSLGMQPAFTGTPPPLPINFSSVFSIPLQDGTNSLRINALTLTIDAWFRTGLAVNNVSGVTVPWS